MPMHTPSNIRTDGEPTKFKVSSPYANLGNQSSIGPAECWYPISKINFEKKLAEIISAQLQLGEIFWPKKWKIQPVWLVTTWWELLLHLKLWWNFAYFGQCYKGPNHHKLAMMYFKWEISQKTNWIISSKTENCCKIGRLDLIMIILTQMELRIIWILFNFTISILPEVYLW